MAEATSPARWVTDPTGRFEHRYWDGARWTHHVANRGTPALDLVEWAPAADEHHIPPPPAGAGLPGRMGGAAGIVAPQPPPPTGIGLRPSGGWRGIDGLRTALAALLACITVASLGAMVAVFQRLAMVDDFERDPFTFNPQRAQDADDAVEAAAAIWLVLLVVIGIVWVVWQWRCAKNVQALGREGARFGAGWSIGAWFIPLANFVIPAMVVQDLWRATTPGTRPGTNLRSQSASPLVFCWWIAFLFGSGSIQFVGDDTNTSLDAIRNTNHLLLGAFGISVIASVFAITVVVQLTRRFDDRRADVVA
jgi:hypothetical protein